MENCERNINGLILNIEIDIGFNVSPSRATHTDRKIQNTHVVEV